MRVSARLRRTGAVAAVLAAVCAVVIPAAGARTSRAPLAGTWSGWMAPDAGSHAHRHRLTVTVNAAERGGVWSSGASCHGTLRLKDISYGYHHYTEIAAAGSDCRGGGVDCLKRAGAAMVDVFVSRPGTALNTTGRLTRVRAG